MPFTITEHKPGYDIYIVQKDDDTQSRREVPAADAARYGLAAAWTIADLRLENRVLRSDIVGLLQDIDVLRERLGEPVFEEPAS